MTSPARSPERLVVPLTIPARDEARGLGACLDSLAAACAEAEARLPVTLAPLVVLDDTRDASESIARARGIAVRRSTGGKVAAMCAGVRPAPFQIFADADIAVSRDAVAALCGTLLADPDVVVAMPAKLPHPPRRRYSPLARALHVYNARRGFSAQRTWFSGKLFAIRTSAFAIPERAELARRAAALPASPFHAYGEPLRVDDIYLSRAIVAAHGPEAIRETAGVLYFRAPETLAGMYRYYRRMRRELARIDALFPDLAAAARRYGTRTPVLAGASFEARAAYAVFASALAACKLAYAIEATAVDRFGVAPRDPWPAIAETK